MYHSYLYLAIVLVYTELFTLLLYSSGGITPKWHMQTNNHLSFQEISQAKMYAPYVTAHTFEVIVLVIGVPDNSRHPVISYTPQHFTGTSLFKQFNVLSKDENND